MYRILYNDSTIFDPYGNENEVVTDASMSVEINAAAYMDFTMSRLHPLYKTIAERDGVVTLYWDGNVLFQGVIESIDIDIQGNKAISCVSALDYLNDTVVRPYSTIAGEQELTAPSSVDGYFQWLIDQHNERVLDSRKRFDVGVNQGANLQQNNFIYRSSTNNPTTASEISDQLLNALGGYLTMRYVDDRYVLDLYADLHTMNTQIVDFGVNITDFSKTIDTKDQYTALILKGGSPEFQGGDFESGDWSHWVAHPNEPLVGDKTHGGDVSSYFVSGAGEYVNDSFFYFRSGRRYKATVYVKNERGSNVTIHGGYQYEQSGTWTTVNVGTSLTVENKDDQWVEFSFDFQPNLSEHTKIRPRWYFDNVANDSNRRVYLDDFSFSQVSGDTDVAEDPISVSMVPDGGTQYDSNILKTGDVIYDPSSVSRYGYKEEMYEDSTITDVDDLLQAGIKELNKLKDPQIGLDIKAVDLALFMEGHTHLNVGDVVRVRSAIHDTDEFLMVNSITLDLQDPGQSEYNIGKAYDSLTGQQSGFLRSLNSGINSSLDAVASLDQTTNDQAIQIGNVEQVANDASEKADNAQNIANSNKQSISDLQNQQSEQDKLIEQMQQGINDSEKEINAINDRIERMDSDATQIQANIDAVRQEAQTNFETAQAAADSAGKRADAAQKAVDSLRESTSSELKNVKDSVSGVRSDVDAVTQKAADLASELDGTKATVEQVVTEQGEIKTTVSNAVEKADQSLQVSTQASQTATQAQTTATSAYRDAQSALTQSSTASQTANAVKTELETKYSTTDEIAEQYATKSLVEQTSQSITSTVEATYATKATVEALENIANNAVQTWMGSGVPTLSNKPASDWGTAELKSQHSGDIYYDTNTGYSYRFGSPDGRNYSWSLIKDTDISKAIADAAKAQQTAEGVSDEVTQLKTDIPATYATKSEVKQTTDSIKSSVSEVATTANSALSKATTVEQTTKGLQTTVTEQAKKLDGAVTTISQVSQRVDSVSSTITQVQGDLADVDAKADTAQGTANSALSQASRVEQSLDSFKTSVSRDYQTKTDALSQKSELEQNINSFKTTVSETYTTKDEFNALEIGGTNLIKGSKPYGKSGFFKNFNSVTDNEYGELTLQSTTTSQSYPRVSLDYSDTFTFDKTDIVTGDKYVISYDIMMLERTYTASSSFTESWIGIRHNGGNWSGLITYDYIKEDFLHAPLNEWAHFEHPITANAWDGTTNVGSAIQFGTKSVGKFHFRMRNVKLEKGTKATAWSPAPEDFDGKYTSKTEFKQTTDKISATATAASQNASSALSKISSLQVSVDGIDAKVEENASDIADAVKTTSQVSQRVDSLSSTITQVSNTEQNGLIRNGGFETGDMTGWTTAYPGTQTFVEKRNNAGEIGDYLCRFYRPSNNNDNTWTGIASEYFPIIAGHTYQITIAVFYSDAPRQTAVGLRLESGGYLQRAIATNLGGHGTWHQLSGTVKMTSGNSARLEIVANGTTGETSRILVDGVSVIDVTEGKTANDTANSALSKSSSVEQNLNSFKTSVSQNYETKSDALSKQSSLQQSVNNLRTEVSETYTTKTEFNNLQVGGTNIARDTQAFGHNGVSSTEEGYLKGYVNRTNGTYKGLTVRNIISSDGTGVVVCEYLVTNVKHSEYYTLSFWAKGSGRIRAYFYGPSGYIAAKAVSASNGDGNAIFSEGAWNMTVSSSWQRYFVVYQTAPSGGTSTDKYMLLRNDNDMASCDVCGVMIERGNKASDWSASPLDVSATYSTKSYVDQTSRTVSLGVVEEYKNGQHGSALATQSDITAAKNSITSTVSQTYLSKDDASVQYATKTQVQQTSDSLTVKITESLNVANAAAGSSTNYIKNGGPNGTSNPIAGWTVSGNVYKHTFPGGQNHVDIGYTTLAHPIVVGRKYRLSLDARVTSGTFSSSDYFNFGLADGFEYIKAQALTGSWKTYSGVVTSSKETTRVFMSSYVGSSGSKVVEMRNVSMTDVTETYNAATNALSTANTANSNAQNAQNRVGNLETCIKMTSDGVRVGKISNGNFTGYSALVNSAGSFDILDSSTKTLASFNKDGLRVNSSSDRGMVVGFNPNTNSGYIGSTPRSTSIGDDYIDVGMNMDFSSGGDLSIIDRLGRISLIGNGIQLTTTGNDRVGINFMDVRGAGVVLFDKDDAHNYSSVEIAIGYKFSDFNYIMCFFKTNDGQYFGGTAYHPNGKEYCFTTMGGGSGTTDMSYLKGTRWVFNGTKATRKTTFEIGPGYSTAVNDAVLHIVAIVGFDYYKTSG